MVDDCPRLLRLASIPPDVPIPNPSCFGRLREGTTGGLLGVGLLGVALEVEDVAWGLAPFLVKSCHEEDEEEAIFVIDASLLVVAGTALLLETWP